MIIEGITYQRAGQIYAWYTGNQILFRQINCACLRSIWILYLINCKLLLYNISNLLISLLWRKKQAKWSKPPSNFPQLLWSRFKIIIQTINSLNKCISISIKYVQYMSHTITIIFCIQSIFQPQKAIAWHFSYILLLGLL